MSKTADFISTREAARRLGVGLTTVQQWVESGALPAWKTAGGHRRIPVAAVEAVLQRQQQTLEKAPAMVQDSGTDTPPHDALGNLPHQEGVLKAGQALLDAAQRTASALSALVLRIDPLPAITSAHGARARRAAMLACVQALMPCLRGSDFLGRIGDDSFCILLPDTNIDAAATVAERCRAAVAAAPLGWQEAALELHASIGVASSAEGRSAIGALIDAASTALQQAEQHGGDRIWCDGRDNAGLPVVRLIWNGQYRSGNTAIDTDHEYLFERANTLLVDMQRNADDGALAADLQDLLIWLSTHFRTEERILAGIDWHGLAEHTRQHRALEARGRRILADIQAGNGNFGDLLDFVVMDVISRHLAQHDVGFFSSVPKGAGGRHAPG